MPSSLLTSLHTKLFPSQIWATYGIKTASGESLEMQSLDHITHRKSLSEPNLIIDTSPSPSTTIHLDPVNDQAATTSMPVVPAAPTAASNPSPPRLSTATIAGLCTGIGIFIFLISYLVLEICVLRKRRKEQALRKAVEEVERGSVKDRELEERELENRDRTVMESKVEVVIGEEVWEVQDGRKGMSLPRRVQ